MSEASFRIAPPSVSFENRTLPPVRGGQADPGVRRSRGLSLRDQQLGEPFEVQDPADQIGLLPDAGQPTPSEAAEPVPVLALAKEFLNLLPAALRQPIPEPPGAHSHPSMGQGASAGLDRDVR